MILYVITNLVVYYNTGNNSHDDSSFQSLMVITYSFKSKINFTRAQLHYRICHTTDYVYGSLPGLVSSSSSCLFTYKKVYLPIESLADCFVSDLIIIIIIIICRNRHSY